MPTLRQRVRAFINPAAIRAGYNAAEITPNRRHIPAPLRSARTDMAKYSRERIMGLARELERNDALVNRFLDLVEQYAVGPHGLRIVPATSSREWNDAAMAELTAWSPNADLSSRLDWPSIQNLVARLMCVDGEAFINLTASPDSGFPRLQLIEAHRVDTPPEGASGKTTEIVDGVEINAWGRPVRYWVKPEAADWQTKSDEWEPIDADNMVHIIEPSRVGQYRGFSIFYPVINDLIDLQELQALEMLAAKDAASTSKVVKTASGEVDDEYVIGRSLSKVENTDGDKHAYYRDALGAETVVLRNGDEFQQFRSDRPSVAVQQFWDYVSARAMAGAGLPVEIILMRSLQGTMTRAALDMASGWFRARSAVLAGQFARVTHHVLEFAARGKRVPSLPDDYRKWRYTPPRSINVDVGRNSAALINEFKAGFRTLENICAEHGWDWRELLEQKATEMAYARELAEANGLDRAELIQLDPNEFSRKAREDASGT